MKDHSEKFNSGIEEGEVYLHSMDGLNKYISFRSDADGGIVVVIGLPEPADLEIRVFASNGTVLFARDLSKVRNEEVVAGITNRPVMIRVQSPDDMISEIMG